MDVIAQIKKPIEKELLEFDKMYHDLHSSGSDLINSINKYILERRGKQMRSITILLVAKMLGEINDSTYVSSIVLELLHNASLLHDDVIDETLERRGEKSVNALWTSKEAVLMGDFLLSKGLVMAADTDNLGILKIVSMVGKELSEGELMQTALAHSLNTTEQAYYQIIARKTAILFSSCSKAGALTVNASSEDVDKMEQFGHFLGMAFQIKDDLFDYQLDASIGKPTGNDLKERKLTLPILYVMSKMSADDKNDLIAHIRLNHRDPKKMAAIITQVIEGGGIEYSINKMNEYKNKSLAILDTYEDSPAKQSLVNLVCYTIERPF